MVGNYQQIGLQIDFSPNCVSAMTISSIVLLFVLDILMFAFSRHCGMFAIAILNRLQLCQNIIQLEPLELILHRRLP